MKGKLLLAALPMVFLSGCMQFVLSAEDLMRPPALTQEQLDISTALERAVGDDDIKYKYPENGEYRSSFLFYDLDEDGEEEALVFYQAPSKGNSTWVNILDKQDGQWVSVFDLSAPNQETEVEFISFQPLLEGENCMVIGWADEYLNDKSAVVYRYKEQTLSTLFEESYDYLNFCDLNNDSTLDMLAVSYDPYFEESTVSFISTMQSITGKVSLERWSSLTLPYEGAELLSVKSGMVDNVTPGLFIDSKINVSRTEAQYVTQLVSAYGHELVNLLDTEDSSLSESTLRPTATLCQDVNKDGFMEIPTVSPLPGYEQTDSEDSLYLTTFNQLGVGRSWNPVGSYAINEELGYMLKFPSYWLNKVTIVSQPESKEWSFIEYNNSLEDSSTLLLRLKVYSSKDYHDKFESDSLQLLGTQGLFEYYAQIPQLDRLNPLALSQGDVASLIVFLN